MFANRLEAGTLLSLKIERFKDQCPVILSLGREGLEVAHESIRKFNLYWDFIPSEIITAFANKEFTIGAICSDGTYFIDDAYVKKLNISKEYIQSEISIKKEKIASKIKTYRGNRPFIDIKNKTVIIIDYGITTGFTAMAAIKSLKNQGAKKVIVAVPVLPKNTLYKLESMVDEVIYLVVDDNFYAAELYYKDFPKITDELLCLLIENLSGVTI